MCKVGLRKLLHGHWCIVAHGALSLDCRLTLMDGALVELGIWRACADEFVGPDINHAISVLEKQQQEITDCCQMLLDTGRLQDGEPHLAGTAAGRYVPGAHCRGHLR